jgi:hypothetical protein
MEDIFLYDCGGYALHCVETRAISVNWFLKYNGIGTFEAVFPRESDIARRLLQSDKWVLTQGTGKAAVFTGLSLGENLTVYGRTPNWLLSRRLAAPFRAEDLSGVAKDTEGLAYWMVSQCFSPSADKLYTAGAQGLSAQNEAYGFDEYRPLDRAVREVLDLQKLGHTVELDRANKRWLFRVLKGSARNVTLSEADKNAAEARYDRDVLESFNGARYLRKFTDMGSYPSAETPSLSNNSAANFGKSYKISADGTYFNAAFSKGDYLVCDTANGAWKKADKADSFWTEIASAASGIDRAVCVLRADNPQDAAAELAQKRAESVVSAKTAGLSFGKDYDLGDLLKARVQCGDFSKTAVKRVTGVRIWQEFNNAGEAPVLEEETQ